MKLNIIHRLGLLCAFLVSGVSAFGQNAPVDIAIQYLNANHEKWGLAQSDISAPIVTDHYTDRSTGITRIWLQQQYEGTPVYNALANLNINAQGVVYFSGNRFVPSLSAKVNTATPIISAEEAVKKLAAHLGLTGEPLRLLEQGGAREFIFEKGEIATENIRAELVFQPSANMVRLAWDITFHPINSSDLWSTRVDAVNGKILNEQNLTVYCNVSPHTFSRSETGCADVGHHHPADAPPAMTGETYNVWPIPLESPNHGPRAIVTEPQDLSASPLGWHDTGSEQYTITRGNNVHAYEDSGNNGSSVGNEPDGGADLIFDFPWNADGEPSEFQDAAVTQLFYMNNIMHDFSYHYGFDEAAGNFQVNNFGNGGNEGDYVRAEAQDGSGTNNANFATPTDGGIGRMQMFLWNSANPFLQIIEPAVIEGSIEVNSYGGGWGAGAIPSSTPVTAEVAIVNDNVEEPYTTDACETIANAGAIDGKIALIDRGGCAFGFKALQAQNAGAVGVIICNFEPGLLSNDFGGGTDGGQVNIPTVFISGTDCQTIRQFVEDGLVATLSDPGQTTPLDGTLDNGIVAHEYTHGISKRLTGGPSNTACLSNAAPGDPPLETMGEGWSDFIALATTVKAGEEGPTKRGIATYAQNQPTTGNGSREFAYSTDMAINPHTYADLASQNDEYGVGSIWCVMLWDMYWGFVEKYNWDADLYNGTGGNNMAIRLVFEGLKNQPCEPGFVDGRDAILQADMQLYGGENQCLILKAFAKRGCGMGADQGSPFVIGDETVSFEVPCNCREELSIEKNVTPTIEAGQAIAVSILVSNCQPEAVTNVTVTDELAEGTSFVAGSSNVPADVQGNTIVFDLGEMGMEQTKEITYTLDTDPERFSKQLFLDDVPNFDGSNWEASFIGDEALNLFQISNNFGGVDDNFAWTVAGSTSRSRQQMVSKPEEVPLDLTNLERPALRFFHKYNTEPAVDGGVVDVRETGTSTWLQVQENMLRNGYPGNIQYGTFTVPNLQAFSGFSGNDFEPTYVDLSSFAGQDLQIRFRFGTNENTSPTNAGWRIDNIELMDLVSYNGEACVNSAEADNTCTTAPEEGTIVESKLIETATIDRLENLEVAIFPNPTSTTIHVQLHTERQMELTLSLLTVEGKELMSRRTSANGNRHLSLDVSHLPGGVYFVKISSEEGVLTKKVIIE